MSAMLLPRAMISSETASMSLRVCKKSPPAGICVSGAVRDRQKVSLIFACRHSASAC